MKKYSKIFIKTLAFAFLEWYTYDINKEHKILRKMFLKGKGSASYEKEIC